MAKGEACQAVAGAARRRSSDTRSHTAAGPSHAEQESISAIDIDEPDICDILPTPETPEAAHASLEQNAPVELVSAEPGFCTNRAPTAFGFPFSAAAGQIPVESGQRRQKREGGPAMVASVVQRPPVHRDELGGAQTGRRLEILGCCRHLAVRAEHGTVKPAYAEGNVGPRVTLPRSLSHADANNW